MFSGYFILKIHRFFKGLEVFFHFSSVIFLIVIYWPSNPLLIKLIHNLKYQFKVEPNDKVKMVFRRMQEIYQWNYIRKKTMSKKSRWGLDSFFVSSLIVLLVFIFCYLQDIFINILFDNRSFSLINQNTSNSFLFQFFQSILHFKNKTLWKNSLIFVNFFPHLISRNLRREIATKRLSIPICCVCGLGVCDSFRLKILKRH